MADKKSFVTHWASNYEYPQETKYVDNIGRPLSGKSIQELFEWKNGSVIAKHKRDSIAANYPLTFRGDLRDRYLNYRRPGGAIWNIFYLHCLDPQTWPIFDQHTYRAMRYLETGAIIELGGTKKQKYAAYDEFIPFLLQFKKADKRKVDKALFSFGRFLKLAARYA